MADKYRVSFGKGGYGEVERKLLDEIVCDTKQDADIVAENFRNVGYWTVVRKEDND